MGNVFRFNFQKQLPGGFLQKRSSQNFHNIDKRLQYRCFPVNIAKFLTAFFTEHPWWLILNVFYLILKRNSIFDKSLSYEDV